MAFSEAKIINPTPLDIKEYLPYKNKDMRLNLIVSSIYSFSLTIGVKMIRIIKKILLEEKGFYSSYMLETAMMMILGLGLGVGFISNILPKDASFFMWVFASFPLIPVLIVLFAISSLLDYDVPMRRFLLCLSMGLIGGWGLFTPGIFSFSPIWGIASIIFITLSLFLAYLIPNQNNIKKK